MRNLSTFLGTMKISSNIKVAQRSISSLTTQILLACYYGCEKLANMREPRVNLIHAALYRVMKLSH